MDLSSERLQYRGKTAIGRPTFSRPVKLALRDRIITSEKTVLDYGCGRGGDVTLLNSIGVDSVGWDPNHFADGKRQASDVVNLGYVVNVIEDPAERVSVLKDAYSLANECLIVSAQTEATTPSKGVPYGDGILTTRNTFQKYFATEALRSLIEHATGARAFLVEKGIFFVFKTDEASSRYLLAKQLISPAYRGRPKLRGLDVSSEKKREDVALTLAVLRFRGASLLDDHSVSVTDCEKHFGSINNATQVADQMLKAIGDRAGLLSSFKSAPCGKLLPDSFYFHRSALDSMPVTLRLFGRCALALVGDVGEDMLFKITKSALNVSILIYPEFSTAPHPELQRSLMVDLKTKIFRTRNYSSAKNPPILHRKEAFVMPNFPGYEAFQMLTRKEEELGLLSRADIGFKQIWEDKLDQVGFDPKSYITNLSISSNTYTSSAEI